MNLIGELLETYYSISIEYSFYLTLDVFLTYYCLPVILNILF
jgi:hypothetical protein